MRCTLTEYRRPRTCAADGHGNWRGLGGWHREGAGWRRVYESVARRRMVARRAVVERVGGWWVWRIEEFELRSRAVRRVVNRSARGRGYLSAAAAWPFADAAALADY